MLGRQLFAITALAVLVFGAVAVVGLNVAKGLPWSVGFSAVATFVVTVAVAAVVPVRKLLGWARGTLPLSDTTLAQAREDLARALAFGWAEEERLRRINDPWPLPVRWLGPDAGQFEEIGKVFTGLASRRLVILGPAGAGKTALAIKLVRELLQARRPGDPVPVLLAAATWTDSRTMTDWIADQLALDHPGLAVQVRTGTGDTIPLARSLAASEVLPVIDGLDELPEGRRAQVVAEVNAHGSDSPLVLTCRPDEYETATATRPVTAASVITLVPLDLADVRAYLKEATDAPADRWRVVFDVFDADPGGPLAEALTNPLMLWLARTVYERGATQPGELADRGRFTDRDAIEGHLLAGFVPAAYASRFQARGFRCSPAQAQRWLGFLAAWQSRVGSQDIAWWRLCLAERGWSVLVFTIRTVLYACLVWLAVTWALTRRGYWRAGAYTGHGHFRRLLLAGPLGRAVRPLTGPVVKVFPPGFDSAVDSFLRPVLQFGVARTAVVAVVAGLILGVLNTDQAPAPQTPRATLAMFRSKVLWRWLWVGILAWVWWRAQVHREPIPVIASLWRTQLVLIWIGVLTVGWFVSWLAVPVDVSSAPGPVALLRSTRWVYVLRCVALLAWVATVWLWAGTTIATAEACVTVAGFVIVAVLGSAASGAWPRYVESRLRLSVRRRLPWRTLSFLADAHRRGVLRQVGAAYQFRHIRLQEQLAAGYSSWPPRLAPRVAYTRGVIVDAWTLARERLADWQADPQVVTVNADMVSGVIAVRSPGDSIRQQLVSIPYPVLLGAGVVLILCLGRWYFFCAGLFLVGTVLMVISRARLRRHKAGSGVVPRSWTLQVTPDRIDVSRDGSTIALGMSDVERLEVERVRSPNGSFTEWTALHARLRREFTAPFPIYERDLPLVWLTAKSPGAGYRTMPQLQAAVRWFPDELLSASMVNLKRTTATEFSASGRREVPPVPWGDSVLPSFALSVALFIFGQQGLGIACFLGCLIMLGACVYRLSQRAAMRMLPGGPWSLRVTHDGIDVEANGVVTHLTPGDVEEAELRTLRGARGRKTPFSAVQLRLRPGVTAPYLTRDGWFPVYWELTYLSSGVPTELMAALRGFAGHRFGSQLASLAKTKQVRQS
jgi:hypothetical protein